MAADGGKTEAAAVPAAGLYPQLGAGKGEGRTVELATTLLLGVAAAAAACIVRASGFHAPGAGAA
ncbi:MAG: hypothetical protein IJS32_09710, partial [Kiritimatiellae bacterium]|nr:hypothetical protein [Kiritimatiellia bacterium]